jgi:ribosomal protein S18 acetylase RimI-like enzyme
MTEIQIARFPEQLELVRDIFAEYAESLQVDLAFQDFATELANLPGKYSAPGGRVLLALRDDEVIGCVAMRALDDTTAEMKRLYVRPAGRSQQLGRQLAERICQVASEAGYKAMRLDCLPTLTAAQQLYLSLGFKPIGAYVYNPIDGTQFMERDLSAS